MRHECLDPNTHRHHTDTDSDTDTDTDTGTETGSNPDAGIDAHTGTHQGGESLFLSKSLVEDAILLCTCIYVHRMDIYM